MEELKLRKAIYLFSRIQTKDLAKKERQQQHIVGFETCFVCSSDDSDDDGGVQSFYYWLFPRIKPVSIWTTVIINFAVQNAIFTLSNFWPQSGRSIRYWIHTVYPAWAYPTLVRLERRIYSKLWRFHGDLYFSAKFRIWYSS